VPFQLQAYLELFPQICQTKFSRRFDFARIESDFRFLARGERDLQPRDILKVFEERATPFGRYWNHPPEKELAVLMKGHPLRLGPVTGEPDITFLQPLLQVLKSTALVSILLRFAHPDHFGIISSPVLHLLQVQRANTADLYLAYCAELKEWKRHFRMESVAKTDMALWAFYQFTEGGLKGKDSEAAIRSFEQDIWVQQRRLHHVLSPFLKRYGTLEFARLLALDDPNLAGKVAGEEYERLLRLQASRFPGFKFETGWAKRLIHRLSEVGEVAQEHRPELERIWEIRNASMHPTRTPTTEEVEVMVDQIERICGRWAKK
jgi:hypothetical protein